MNRSRLPVPAEEIERRLSWRAVSVLMFLASLLALGTLAGFSLLVPPPVAEGLPDDPLALEARAALAGRAVLGFDGLRFRCALIGEATPDRAIPVVDGASAARAESLLRQVARRHLLEPRASATLGSLALARRRWAEAEQLFRRAVDVRALCPEARLGLGVALAEQALTQTDRLRARALELEAIAQFAAVTPGSGLYPHALYDRALLLERVGRTAEARRRAREYLAREPAGPWAKRLAVETGLRP